MRRTVRMVFLTALFAFVSFAVTAKEVKERPPIDIKDLLLEHLKDSYSWHFFDTKDKSIALPLPIIVRSKERGWLCSFLQNWNKKKDIKDLSYLQKGIQREK